MLKEGSTYDFLIVRLIQMPPDNEPFFVLKGEDGLKYLMPEKYYFHYGLKAGMNIQCRVDKINCSGKIYLEPSHPWCRSGDLITFKNSGAFEVINSFGEPELIINLRDPWGCAAHLNITMKAELAKAELLQCRVERIKKGKIMVSCPDIQQFSIDFPDEKKPFIISGLRTLIPENEYYILRQDDAVHYLRTKYYARYGFENGSTIHCRVLDSPRLFFHYLEPMHPIYQIGEVYSFDFIRFEQSKEVNGIEKQLLVVKDQMDHEYTLNYYGPAMSWVKRVTARVKSIRMSKCSLELIDIQ